MLRPSMEQIITKMEQIAKNEDKPDVRNLSYYSVVIGIAKRAHEISQQRFDEKERSKKDAERRGTSAQDHKARIDDKMLKALMMEENPVKTAVDEFAAGKFRLSGQASDGEH